MVSHGVFKHCFTISSTICQGTSWLHVGTDQPFISISIGAFYQVWAVARDGSAFYRGSVSPKKPAGEYLYDFWLQSSSYTGWKLYYSAMSREDNF